MNFKRGPLSVGVAVGMMMATRLWAQQTNTGHGQPMPMQHEPGMQMQGGQVQS